MVGVTFLLYSGSVTIDGEAVADQHGGITRALDPVVALNGLRLSEIDQLRWGEIHLEAEPPGSK